MRVVSVSATGFGYGILPFLSNEGHSVSFTTDIEHPDFGVDIAIFDSHVFSRSADDHRKKGVKVLGTSAWTSQLSTNPEYKDRLIDAIGYKRGTGDTHGLAVGWFNGNKYISRFIVLNYTHMMSGDVGVGVESSGFMAHFPAPDAPIFKHTLDPLERFLRKASFKGCFCVSFSTNQKGEVFVNDIYEGTTAPYTQAIFENSRKSKSDVLLDVFNESSSPVVPIDPYVCGVMLSVYPYPFTSPVADVAITGLNTLNLKHFWLIDMADTKPNWTCRGLSGCLGYVIARGVSPSEARRRAYRTTSNIQAPGLQYRNDIGQKTEDTFGKLRSLRLI